MTVQVTPDGVRYLTAAQGRPVPWPFHLRWLLPKILGARPGRWLVCSRASLVVYCAGVAALGGFGWRGLVAGLLIAGLPSTRFHWCRPILVDATAQALAVGAAVCAVHAWWLPAVALVLVAGMVKEPAPIFAAVFAWHPVLLAGLAFPVLRRLISKPGPDVLDERNADILAHPLKWSLIFHKGKWRDPLTMLAPWGGCLAATVFPSPQLAVAVCCAYGSLLVATDTVRLYQWAAPVAALAAVQVPVGWLVPLVLLTWFNPLAGDGI